MGMFGPVEEWLDVIWSSGVEMKNNEGSEVLMTTHGVSCFEMVSD